MFYKQLAVRTKQFREAPLALARGKDVLFLYLDPRQGALLAPSSS